MADEEKFQPFGEDSYTIDEHRNRVLRGLNIAETAELEAYQRKRQADRHYFRNLPDRAAQVKRYTDLMDRHRIARGLSIAAQEELKRKPTIN